MKAFVFETAMHMRRAWLTFASRLLAAFLAPGLICMGQAKRCEPAEPDTRIVTERPAFTDASTSVPCHSLQLESGLLESAYRDQRSFDVPEALLRFGIIGKTEVRFFLPNYYENTAAGDAFATGLGDLAVGVKQQLGPVKRFDAAASASVSMPTGAQSVSSHGYDAAVQLAWSRALSEAWTVAGMFASAWPTQDGRHHVTGQATLLLDRQLTKPWDVFVEYSGMYPGSGSPQHLLHFGTAYKLTPRQQVDVHGGVGLSAATPDHFVGFGYSIRFDTGR